MAPRLPTRVQLISTLKSLPGPTADIDSVALAQCVDTVAAAPRAQVPLHNYILSEPGFTGSGDPMMPRVAQRLLRELQATGVQGLILPRCMRCHEPRLLVQTLDDGSRACHRCTQLQYVRPCGVCGLTRQIASTRTGVDHCKNCWRKNPASFKECARCGRLGSIAKRTDEGLLCPRCAPGTISQCHTCAKRSPVLGYLLGGPQCDRCYHRISRSTRSCPCCGEQAIIAYLDSGQAPCCASCAGVTARFACVDCGGEEGLHGKRCFTCWTKKRTLELITDDHGVVNDTYKPVRQLLRDSKRTATMAELARKSDSADLIRRFVNCELDLDHASLDAWSQVNTAEYVRRLFVTAGLLTARDENLRRFESWTSTFLQDQTPQARKDLEPYLRWTVGRQLRVRARQRPLKQNSQYHARQQAQAASGFISYLAARGLQLPQATQTLVEDCVMEKPRIGRFLPGFLQWAAANTAMPDLSVHTPRKGHPNSAMSEQDYWTAIRRLETDTAIPLRIRIAGLFVGLYAQPFTRISAITDAQIMLLGRQMHLSFGPSPIQAPDHLASMITEHQRTTSPWELKDSVAWLFPSRQAGNHISTSVLTKGLSRIGINTRELRGAGLINLAAHIPLRPLCDLTGLGTMAAARWADLAGRSWNAYPQLRTENYSITAENE